MPADETIDVNIGFKLSTVMQQRILYDSGDISIGPRANVL